MEPVVISVFGGEVTIYGILAVVIALLACVSSEAVFARRGLPRGFGLKASLFSAFFGLIAGRGLYCALQAERLFYDPMGKFLGAGPFFDLRYGSVNVIGVLFGCFLALWLFARLSRVSFSRSLEAAVFPGLFCFAALRFIEPLSGQGYGPILRSGFLSRVPFGIPGWDEWSLSVCFFEGLLLTVLAFVLLRVRARVRFARHSSLFILAAVWAALSQIIPESLRQDDALRVFVFARVDQMGFVLIWLLCGVYLWCADKDARSGGAVIAREAAVNLIGILILIAAEFTLDKTDWSKYLIYGAMALTLITIGVTLSRAVIRSERAA